MAYALGQKLLHHGRLLREEAELRQNPASNAAQLADLRKRLKLSYNDTASFIQHQAAVEVQVAVGCIAGPCERHLLKLLALVVHDQMSGAEGPTIAEACRICSEPHAEKYESFLVLRHDIIESIAGGCYWASKSPIFFSTAVLRLSRRLLFIIGGGITTGLSRIRDVQRASWRRDD